jgi:hypothetical protein
MMLSSSRGGLTHYKALFKHFLILGLFRVLAYIIGFVYLETEETTGDKKDMNTRKEQIICCSCCNILGVLISSEKRVPVRVPVGVLPTSTTLCTICMFVPVGVYCTYLVPLPVPVYVKSAANYRYV